MNPRPNVRRNLAWQYSGHVVEALTGVAVLAYVVRNIAVAEYGLFLLALSLSSALLLLDLGLGPILVPVFVREQVHGGESAATRLLTTTFLAMTGLGTIGLLICAGLSRILPGPFQIPAELLPEAGVVILLAGGLVQLNLPGLAIEAMYKATHRFAALSQIQITLTLARALATIAVLEAGYGLIALLLVQLAGAALRIALMAALLPRLAAGVRLSLPRRDWSAMRPLIGPAAWAALENTGRQLAIPSGAILLGMFASMDAVAIFGVGSRIPLQLWALINRGTGVALPLLAQRHAEADLAGLRELFGKVVRTTLLAMIPVLLFLALFSESVILVLAGPQYSDAASILRWLLITTAVATLSAPAYAMLYGTGKVAAAARISVGESAAYIAAGLLLVVPYAGAGLAMASAISHLGAAALWYVPKAAAMAGIDTLRLCRNALTGSWSRMAALLLAAVIVVAFTRSMTPVARLTIAAAAGALLYLAVWLPVLGLGGHRAAAKGAA